MNKILSYIRHNRLKIIFIIIAIILGLSLIRVADNMYAEKGKDKIREEVVTIENHDGIDISNKASKELINSFLKACTSGKYEIAYEYLSEDCRSSLYPTKEDFIEKYCLAKSIKSKNYSVEEENNVSSYTYKVSFNNMLSSGKINAKAAVDYYTIGIDNNVLKLNINGLLAVENKNIKTSEGNLELTVEKINIYKNYKEVCVKYKNNSNQKIYIDKDVAVLTNDNEKILQNNIENIIKLEANESKIGKYIFNTNYDKKIKQVNVNYSINNEKTETIQLEF